MTNWRQIAVYAIATVQLKNPDAHGDELRDLLRDAYPFGPRKHWPYRVWLACVREACGVKPAPLPQLRMFEDA